MKKSLKKLKISMKIKIYFPYCLITKDFSIHSSFSILPKQLFNIDSKGILKNLNYILNSEKKLNFSKITINIENTLKQYFLVKNAKLKMEDNEFLIVDNFNEMFDVNPNFCIWIDNDNLNLIYKIKDKENIFIDIKLTQYTRITYYKYTLICSIFKIKCINKFK